MIRPLRVAVVLSLLTVALPAGAYVLDQYQELMGGDTSVMENRKLAQTFTPGLTEILAFVDIGISNVHTPGDLNVSITRTVDGLPSLAPGDVLATVVVPKGGITSGWERIDFEQENLTLTEGDLYSIVLEAGESDTWIRWRWYDDPASYAGGGLYTYTTAGQTTKWWEGPGPFHDPADSVFRTYMVPEPGLLGLLAIAAARLLRRRR